MPVRHRGHDLYQPVIDDIRSNARAAGYFTYQPLLLLGTTGARTGLRRTTTLAFLPDGDRYVVVAANAGAPRHPDWYHNLVAHPDATIELGDDGFDVTAELAEGARRDNLYQRFTAQSPQLALYQAATTRRFPMFVLVPR